MVRAVFLVCTWGAVTAGAAAASPFAGHWEGNALREGTTSPFQCTLAETDGTFSGTIALPKAGIRDFPIGGIEADGSLFTADFQSGERHYTLTLKPAGADSLAGTYSGDGFAVDLDLKRVSEDIPYTTEPVKLANGDVTLGGAVYIPKSPGPHAAVVYTHGSGDSERWRFGFHVDWFARQGIACLVLDKRGCGESGGHWEDSDFSVYADDAILGVHFMQQRPEIDPERVGLTGISQAGWIMPLAAVKSDDIAFLLIESGPAVSVEEEGYYDYLVALKDKGYSDDDLDKARKILELNTAVLRDQAEPSERIDAIRAVRREPWYRDMHYTPSPPGDSWYKTVINYDPRETLEAVACPILWLYGSDDKSVETSRCLAILEEIQAAQPKPWTIVTLPRADHGLRVPADPETDALPGPVYPEAYFEAQTAWLRQQGLTRP